LSTELTRTLSELESEIDSTINSMSHDWLRLTELFDEVRQSKLYKAEYGTYRNYLEQRWNISKSHAYRMLAAMQLKKELEPPKKSPIGDKTAQSAETPPEAIESEYDARKILDARKAAAKVEPEPEVEREPGDDAEEYPPRCKIVDANGDRVFLTLEPAFKARSKFGSAERTIRALCTELVKSLKPGPGGTRFDSLSFEQSMKRAADIVASGAPYAICPFYNGIGECVAIKKMKCKTCGGRGWVTRSQYEEATR